MSKLEKLLRCNNQTVLMARTGQFGIIAKLPGRHIFASAAGKLNYVWTSHRVPLSAGLTETPQLSAEKLSSRHPLQAWATMSYQ